MLLDENNLAVQSTEFETYVTAETSNSEKKVSAIERVQPESRTFGIPRVIWASMAASYGIFFTGLILGTGHDSRALFMIAISILYALMYFGTAYVLNSVGATDRKNRPSQWINGQFETHTGNMSFGSVYGQMLIVPIMFAVFGIAIAITRFAAI